MRSDFDTDDNCDPECTEETKFAVDQWGNFMIVRGSEVKVVDSQGRARFQPKWEKLEIAALMSQEPIN